jgi:hypothetical protein
MTMKEMRIKDWLLNVDVEQTARIYSQFHTFAESCGCLYCCNYTEVAKRFSIELHSFFQSLGIDPIKCAGEIMDFGQLENGLHLYGGWYHLVGKIIDGPDCMVPPENWDKISLIKIDSFEMGFTKKLQLVSPNFTESVVQLEFEAEIPWVLEELP